MASAGAVPARVEPRDYGAAALKTAMEYAGRSVPFEDVRAACGPGDALSIVHAAGSFGVEARGVTANVEEIRVLDPGTLLFWDTGHFVVLHSADETGITVVDPAIGRRDVDWPTARASFDGVAMVVRDPRPTTERPRGGLLRRVLRGGRNG